MSRVQLAFLDEFTCACSSSLAASHASAASLGNQQAIGSTADASSSASEAASLSALLATTSISAPAAAAVASIGSSDDAMAGILTVQRQQLRARVEQLEREAAVHRR
jgi:hypothetical protein